MRIIAGTARGRRLAAPKGMATRPTPDRVREALFSILAPEIAAARVLDLYAGTGALGLEALARGAASATFVEKAPGTAALLRRNAELFAAGRARLLAMPVQRALTLLAGEGAAFDLVFADPPYDAGLLPATLDGLDRGGLVTPGGLVVCEHRPGKAPSATGAVSITDERAWGDVAVTIFTIAPKGAAEP